MTIVNPYPRETLQVLLDREETRRLVDHLLYGLIETEKDQPIPLDITVSRGEPNPEAAESWNSPIVRIGTELLGLPGAKARIATRAIEGMTP